MLAVLPLPEVQVKLTLIPSLVCVALNTNSLACAVVAVVPVDNDVVEVPPLVADVSNGVVVSIPENSYRKQPKLLVPLLVIVMVGRVPPPAVMIVYHISTEAALIVPCTLFGPLVHVLPALSVTVLTVRVESR
jgi:hypothetical protein